MDLELSDEQHWLSESLDDALGARVAGCRARTPRRRNERAHLWAALTGVRRRWTELGSSSCAARRGTRRASGHLALPRQRGRCATPASAREEASRSRCWNRAASPSSTQHEVDRFAVVAPDGTVALRDRDDVVSKPGGHDSHPSLHRRCFNVTFVEAQPLSTPDARPASPLSARCSPPRSPWARPSGMLSDACAYAAERRQFGRTIGSYQALRHILADMYVRRASAWSTVLYAAAALDDELPDAQRTAADHEGYVARAAREVAHGALQVFGGIAFTEEHQAHRFLRRIVVREQQFGDAAYHELAIGRALAVLRHGAPA